MKKKTKWSIMAAALALVLAACAVVFLAQKEREQPVKPGNLLENGDFSAVTDGMPDHWNSRRVVPGGGDGGGRHDGGIGGKRRGERRAL